MQNLFKAIVVKWQKYRYRFVPWVALTLKDRTVRSVKDTHHDKIVPDHVIESTYLQLFSALDSDRTGPDGKAMDKKQDEGVSRVLMYPWKPESRSADSVDPSSKSKHVVSKFQDGIILYFNGQGGNNSSVLNGQNNLGPPPYYPHPCHLNPCNPSQNYPQYIQSNILNPCNPSQNYPQQYIQSNILPYHDVSSHLHQHRHNHHRHHHRAKHAHSPSPSNFMRPQNHRPYHFNHLHLHYDNHGHQHHTSNKNLQLSDSTSRTAPRNSRTMIIGHSNPAPRNSPDSDGETVLDGGASIMHRVLGYVVGRRPSQIAGGGTGVYVIRGTVPKGAVVAMYPGTLYYPAEPIFLQSIGNPFVFRCLDGIHIDGNDKKVSKMIYRSCAQRDRVGPYIFCDLSWLTSCPLNPMAVGQYVNNQHKGTAANVCYQEFDVPADFPIKLRKYIPNNFYGTVADTSNLDRTLRTVALVSLREILCGEELLSSYFTLVY